VVPVPTAEAATTVEVLPFAVVTNTVGAGAAAGYGDTPAGSVLIVAMIWVPFALFTGSGGIINSQQKSTKNPPKRVF